jgi:CubicO group peptidase (beta-lactamase class C family)
LPELATGKDWETLFIENIARPLKMTDTHFTPVDGGIGHNPMLGGGARSTLQDYGNFLAMIDDDGEFAGKRVLSAESIREMEANQVGEAVVQREKELPEKVRGATHPGVYGLGEWREQLDSKGEAILISSPSWAGTYPWVDKTHHVFGVLLAHVDMEQASKDHFNAFFESPVAATLVRQILDVSIRNDSGR